MNKYCRINDYNIYLITELVINRANVMNLQFLIL